MIRRSLKWTCSAENWRFSGLNAKAYHQGKSDPAEVKKLLADVKEIEVRLLPLP